MNERGVDWYWVLLVLILLVTLVNQYQANWIQDLQRRVGRQALIYLKVNLIVVR